MPLPTSQPTGGVNANLTLPAVTPVATAPALAALNEAFRQGLLNADDIKNRLTIQPLQDQVTKAQAKDKLSELQVAPFKRQQEMSAAEQQARLRDLQIQSGAQEVQNAPSVADQQKRLNEIRITSGQEANDFTPKKNQADLDLSGERLTAAKLANQYAPDKEQADLEDRKAQAEQRKAAAALATSKATAGATPGGAAYEQERSTRILNDVASLEKRVGANTVGVGSILKGVPATEARNFHADLDSLKANIISSELEQMKAASKNGGGLGRTANAELERLSAALGSLDQGQSPQHFKENLQKVKDSIARWHSAAASGGVASGAPAAAGAAPAASSDTSGLPVVDPANLESFEGGAFVTPTGEKGYKPKIAKPAPAAPVQAPPAAPAAPADPAFRGTGAGSSFDAPPPSQGAALWDDLKNDLALIKAKLGL